MARNWLEYHKSKKVSPNNIFSQAIAMEILYLIRIVWPEL